jgi:hypothetical protein
MSTAPSTSLGAGRNGCGTGGFGLECARARKLAGVVGGAKAEASPPHSKVEAARPVKPFGVQNAPASEGGRYKRKRGRASLAATREEGGAT